jgi:hypothetical protein
MNTGSQEVKKTTKHFIKNTMLNKSIFISFGNITTHNTYTINVAVIEAASQEEHLGTSSIILKFSARTSAVKVIPTKF